MKQAESISNPEALSVCYGIPLAIGAVLTESAEKIQAYALHHSGVLPPLLRIARGHLTEVGYGMALSTFIYILVPEFATKHPSLTRIIAVTGPLILDAIGESGIIKQLMPDIIKPGFDPLWHFELLATLLGVITTMVISKQICKKLQ